jgi:glycosyltransferase involved in cell wall biosynthesis
MSADAPRLSMVICTYNRAERVTTAIASVLEPECDTLELVVVDDGSTDDTTERVSRITDPRLTYVKRENGGLSAARNTGARTASGDYLAFLDDDDLLLPGWLHAVRRSLAEDQCVLTSWAAEVVDPSGRLLEVLRPVPMGAAFEDYDALIRAGTFAVSRHAYLAVGGFTEGLRANEQTDFALRLFPRCRAEGWKVGVIDETLVRIVRAPAEDRYHHRPDYLLSSAAHLVDSYGEQLARCPDTLADYLAVAGVAAARAQQFGTARSYLGRACRVARDPRRKARNAVRLALAAVPPVGRRVWHAKEFA